MWLSLATTATPSSPTGAPVQGWRVKIYSRTYMRREQKLQPQMSHAKTLQPHKRRCQCRYTYSNTIPTTRALFMYVTTLTALKRASNIIVQVCRYASEIAPAIAIFIICAFIVPPAILTFRTHDSSTWECPLLSRTLALWPATRSVLSVLLSGPGIDLRTRLHTSAIPNATSALIPLHTAPFSCSGFYRLIYTAKLTKTCWCWNSFSKWRTTTISYALYLTSWWGDYCWGPYSIFRCLHMRLCDKVQQ